MLSVINTYTVGDSRPLWRFGSIPLTMVSQTKSEWGLTKQAISPKFNSIVFLFLLILSLFENSSMNLSSKSFWADIKFGKEIGSLSNYINYNNKPKHYSIYFSNLVVEREGDKSLKLLLIW